MVYYEPGRPGVELSSWADVRRYAAAQLNKSGTYRKITPEEIEFQYNGMWKRHGMYAVIYVDASERFRVLGQAVL